MLGSLFIFLSLVSASPKDRAESKKCLYQLLSLGSEFIPTEYFGVIEFKAKRLLFLSNGDGPEGSKGMKKSQFALLNERGALESTIVVDHEFENEHMSKVFVWPQTRLNGSPNRLVFQSSKSPVFYIVGLREGQSNPLKARPINPAEMKAFLAFRRTKIGRDSELPQRWNDSRYTIPSRLWAGIGREKFLAQVSTASKHTFSRLEISSANGVIQREFYGTRFSGLLAYDVPGRREPDVILFQSSPFEGPSEHLLSRIHPSMRDGRWKHGRARLLGVFGGEVKVGYQPKGLIEWAYLGELHASTVLVIYERSVENLTSDEKFSGDKVVILRLSDLSVISDTKGGDRHGMEYLRDLHGLIQAFKSGILSKY